MVGEEPQSRLAVVSGRAYRRSAVRCLALGSTDYCRDRPSARAPAWPPDGPSRNLARTQISSANTAACICGHPAYLEISLRSRASSCPRTALEVPRERDPRTRWCPVGGLSIGSVRYTSNRREVRLPSGRLCLPLRICTTGLSSWVLRLPARHHRPAVSGQRQSAFLLAGNRGLSEGAMMSMARRAQQAAGVRVAMNAPFLVTADVGARSTGPRPKAAVWRCRSSAGERSRKIPGRTRRPRPDPLTRPQ